MVQEISPEERLFNVIKAGKNVPHPSSAEDISRPAGAAIEMPLPFDVQSWAEKIDFKKVNQSLTILLFLLMILVGFTLTHKKEISLKKLSAIPLANLQPTNAPPAQTYQPVNVYLKQVKTRDLFHPVPAAGAAPAGTPETSSKEFTLSGIYMGEYPQAIITDVAEQKAYFLKEGDDIKGYKVKSILKDKVILQQGDEEINLI